VNPVRQIKNRTSLAVLIILFGLSISSCLAGSSPADALENYLQALADQDQVTAVNNSCGDWEEQALAEGASFINVEVTLVDLACTVDSQADDSAVVSCAGKYLFSYDAGEEQELDLSGRQFRVIKENGAWRMCGYQ
jgi:hypothetical protein